MTPPPASASGPKPRSTAPLATPPPVKPREVSRPVPVSRASDRPAEGQAGSTAKADGASTSTPSDKTGAPAATVEAKVVEGTGVSSEPGAEVEIVRDAGKADKPVIHGTPPKSGDPKPGDPKV